MATLVSTVTAAATQMFNDLTPTKVLELMNAAHFKICRHVKLYQDTVVDTNLTAGTRYYTFDPDIARVWSAYYVTGANSYSQLIETSSDELDYRETGWRMQANATPYRWGQEGPQFFVDPIPDTTTSGGYPIVRMYTQKRVTLALSDSMPAMIDYYDAWTDEIGFQWAKQKHRDQQEGLRLQAHRSLNDLSWKVQGRPVRLKPTVIQHVPMIRH